MKVSVFGLGYVGCVSAACFAKEGHDVIGVDVAAAKVDMINDGRCPIVEGGLDTLIEEAVAGKHPGSLRATSDGMRAVEDTDLSLVCVGTPSNPNGSLRLDYVKRCARDIGEGMKRKGAYHVVVFRSTMLPNSVQGVLIPELEYASGKKAGRDFGVAVNPEFLRESTSIQDFYNPPVTVIGQLDECSGDALVEMYGFLTAPVVRTEIKVAEMIKYANNSFHGLKVAFANEIGAVCKAMGVDSHRVMEIFCMDDKLNLSPYYLKPGFGFGGSCLPKDLRAIGYKAKENDIEIPVLQSALHSNRLHIDRTIQSILSTGKRKIGILGLSFKAGTDDLRESPLVIVTETLLGKGCDIRIYDKNVALAKLFGANKEFIEKEIPHISTLMSDNLEAVMNHGDVLIVGNKAPEFTAVLDSFGPEKQIFDLVRLTDDPAVHGRGGYEGVCW